MMVAHGSKLSFLLVTTIFTLAAQKNQPGTGEVDPTALVRAARLGHTESLKALVAAGASLDAVDSQGRTALLWAAKEGHTESVKALAAAGASLDLAERDGSTPLIWAACRGHVNVVKKLAAAGASLDLAERDGSTPLIWAAKQGHVNVVKALAAAGASLDLAEPDGSTPLIWAAYFGHANVVKVLTAAGASLDLAESDGSTALFWAAKRGHLDVVTSLVAAGARLNLAGSHRRTPLSSAAYEGHVHVVKALVAAGAGLDLADSGGRTALHWAAVWDKVDMVKALVAAGADLHVVDSEGKTALYYAAWHGNTSQESQETSVRALIAGGVRLDPADSARNAALVRVCNGDAEGVKALVAMGANLDLVYPSNMTALMWAAYAGCTECVEALVAAGARLDLADMRGETALLWAAKHVHTECVKVLVAAGADVDHVDRDDGNTALIWAAMYGDTGSVKALLAAGASLDFACDHSGSTPLMRAAEEGKTETVKALLATGASLDLADLDGYTALMKAEAYNYTETVKVLVAAGASQACPAGQTVLMLAAKAGHNSIVNVLLAAGADKGALSNTGETAVMLAARNGHLDTARLVGDDDQRVTGLMLLAVGGRKLGEVNRSQLHQIDALGRTALMWAAMGGDAETLRELLRLGSNVDARDFAGRQARDYAVLHSHRALLPELPPTAALKQHLSNLHRSYFAFAVALCFLAVFAALANECRGGRCSHYTRVSPGDPLVTAGLGQEHTSQQPSRGAVLAAAKKCSGKKWAKAAKAFRFVEVLCCCVLPMRAMLLIRPIIWLPILVLAHLPAALLWSNLSLGSLLSEPLVLQLVTTRHSLLWGTWSKKACACTALSLLRVFILLSLAAVAWQVPDLPWRNDLGELATTFLEATPQEVYCTGLNLTVALTWFNTAPWTVTSGECTMDGTGCILSPGFPEPYPRSTCTIDVGLPFFLADATEFNTYPPGFGAGGHLDMGGQVYEGTHGPNGSFPGQHITWESTAYDWRCGGAGQRWRICPGHELCVPLPPVGQTWLLLNWVCAVLVCCWIVTAATVLLGAIRRLHGASPSPSTESPMSSSSSAASASSSATSGSWASAASSLEGGAPSDNEGAMQVLQHAQSVETALQRGDKEALRECATLSGPGALFLTAFMLVLDVFLDAFSINSLLLNSDILFAGCIAATVAWSTTREIASGSLWALPREFRRTLATGVPTEGWLDFLDGERGTEALVSLLVSTYGLPFATRTSLQMVMGPLSIASSAWALATFVHEYVDLSVEEH